MRLIFCLFILILSAEASAGNKVGNGGDVVICGETKTLLDLYEAKDRNQALIKPSDSIGHIELTRKRFGILQKFAPKLGAQYLRRLDLILKEIDFKKEMEITSVDDSLHTVLGKDCRLIQIALRKSDVGEGEKTFLIQEEEWNKLNGLNKSALISHEIVYEHLFKLGSQDSRAARRFVAKLYSKDFEKEDSKSFWSFMGSLKVPIYP